MIPIGTPCILINDGKLPRVKEDYVGRSCWVKSYVIPEAVKEYTTMDTEVMIAGLTTPQFTRQTNLLPIGPDESVSRREKEMAA